MAAHKEDPNRTYSRKRKPRNFGFFFFGPLRRRRISTTPQLVKGRKTNPEFWVSSRARTPNPPSSTPLPTWIAASCPCFADGVGDGGRVRGGGGGRQRNVMKTTKNYHAVACIRKDRLDTSAQRRFAKRRKMPFSPTAGLRASDFLSISRMRPAPQKLLCGRRDEKWRIRLYRNVSRRFFLSGPTWPPQLFSTSLWPKLENETRISPGGLFGPLGKNVSLVIR